MQTKSSWQPGYKLKSQRNKNFHQRVNDAIVNGTTAACSQMLEARRGKVHKMHILEVT